MNVLVIPMLSDNFCYYAYKKDDISKGFFVDVSQPPKLDAFTQAFGIPKPTHILTTHKHGDHSGGNNELKERYPDLEVIGGANDSIPGCTQPVNDGDVLNLHGMRIRCLHTPCHTRGHILYYVESDEESKEETKHEVSKVNGYQNISNINRCLFTGDTLFIGGCGRFFEGTAEQMQSAMDRIGELPNDTKVFVGHEYTIKNLEFGLMAEPTNSFIDQKSKEYQKLLDEGLHTVPSLIGEEKQFNVFMRTREQSVQESCGFDDPIKCMQYLREYKNSGTKPNL
ncbi:hydroxyacylglutathione hydrolase [Stylonychia lemnae]|uniref:hydroxyacylglutathione hydrolase n=1 Tax=Stylonychia lemnae TaxID=5949 RepID=A0A078BAQ9_STYLE|nr:hydroxyacylglutathione hydrolase [Stylonychia lemnae]|eukprot:CDW91444.1 hydroxyacylglutathione hydrolase [Stylonychia lemnae]